MKRLLILIILIALLVPILVKNLRKVDYDGQVDSWLHRLYNGEFERVSNNGKPPSYTCTTRDDRQITFTVECEMVRAKIPFAFNLPWKELRISDDFKERLGEYASNLYGQISVLDIPVEEATDRVMSAISALDKLGEEYHISRPCMTFTFETDRGKVTFQYQGGLERAQIKQWLKSQVY